MLLLALISASARGFEDIVKYLLEQKSIKYNVKDEKGRTALMMASTDAIEELFLTRYGVVRRNDLDLIGFKKVELIQAASHGNVKKVQSLLEDEGRQASIEFF